MIPSSEFASRRARLLNLMEPRSVAIIFGGVPKVFSADEDMAFEINRNFHYLTGIKQEDSVLILVNGEGETKEFLFVLPFDELKEKWYGRRLTVQEASEISGIKNVLLRNSFEGKVIASLDPNIFSFGEIEHLYLDLDREIKIADETSTKIYRDEMKKKYPSLSIYDIYPLITTLRLRKSNKEIAELKSAIKSTKLGLHAMWNAMKPGVKEYEMANVFFHTIMDDNGYEGLSFPTIAATGVNAACLHYPTPMATLKDGDLFLSDLGARKNFYCADITRTVPVNGKFTELQRQVYSIVLGANKMVANIARPGITIEELQNRTVEYLADGCLKAGLIKNKEEIANYYFHGVSHLIGLDTHDPYLNPLGRDSKKLPLEPGMIISDEPGLYMKDRGLGVRIEDDILITENGCEVLSKDIIKEIDEIENFLASRK